jgi:hypothetical protein
MEILANIDQAEALRRGYNAPTSSVRVDVDPATLSQEHRDALACILKNGHDARGGQLAACADIRAGLSADYTERTGVLVLTRPGVEGLVEGLDRMLAERAVVASRVAAETARTSCRRDAEAEKFLADGAGTERVMVYLDKDGALVDHEYHGVVRRRVTVPRLPYYTPRAGSSDVQARVAERLEELRAERAVLLAAAEAELRATDYPAWVAAEAAKLAELAELIGRLPSALRERREAGYAIDGEWFAALTELLRADAEFTDAEPEFGDWEELDELNDEEWAKLEAARGHAPEGAKVVPVVVWDDGDPDPYEECDERDTGRVNPRRFAQIRWRRAGIDVEAHVPLT